MFTRFFNYPDTILKKIIYIQYGWRYISFLSYTFKLDIELRALDYSNEQLCVLVMTMTYTCAFKMQHVYACANSNVINM